MRKEILKQLYQAHIKMRELNGEQDKLVPHQNICKKLYKIYTKIIQNSKFVYTLCITNPNFV